MNQYNFTSSNTQAYGNNLSQVDISPIRFAIYSGDVNQDAIVDLSDIVITFNDANNFATGYLPTDVTGDNFTDLSDIVLIFNNSMAFVSMQRP